MSTAHTPAAEPSRLRLSVVLIVHNAADSLAACLASVAFADDLVVVDSGSTDATVAIAQTHGARVIHRTWLGFGPQKQFAIEQALHDWVLCIDADEQVSPELANAIQRALIAPHTCVFRMARCNRFLGRWLRHGEGYPDWSPRLFDRRVARWSDDAVHEKVLYNTVPETLAGDLLHASGESLSRYLDKQNRYSSLAAGQLYAQGKRVRWPRLLLSPLTRFFKFYFFRGGFLDGLPGFVHTSIGCMNSYLKYAKLIELQRNEKS